MRSKRLARLLKKAFGSSFAAELPESEDQILAALPESEAQEAWRIFRANWESFAESIDQSYVQDEDRVQMAQRSIEISSQELTEANRSLFSLNQTFDAMVNSLGQGFFLIAQNGQCLKTASKACGQLLECNPSERHAAEVLRVPVAKRPGFDSWISMLFEEMLPFEELVDLGPKKFPHSQGRTIQLEYKPVRNDSGQVAAVVVIATDRTEEVEATRKMQEMQAYANLIVCILKDRPLFTQFVFQSRKMLERTQHILEQTDFDLSTLIEVKRHLHTLKGGCGSFGMIEVRNLIHHVESDLACQGDLAAARAYLPAMLVKIQELFESVLNANKEVIGSLKEGAGAHREIPLERLTAMAQQIKAGGSAENLFPAFVNEFICVPLKDVFSRYEKVLVDTAHATQKQPVVTRWVGENPALCPEAYGGLWSHLDHLFRNLVDHGIEARLERSVRGKPVQGQVRIECRKNQLADQTQLTIRISDDGHGISEENLGKIFSAGFTTAKSLTEISGRGVGLNAVRSAVEEAGGKIHVESEIGKGTTFILTLPWYQVPEANAARQESRPVKSLAS